MTPPDPDETGLLATLIGAAVAIVTPFMFVRSWIERRLSTKADKTSTEEGTKKCLEHIEKLYENAERDRAQTRDLHDKAMEGIREGQRQIIEILTRR